MAPAEHTDSASRSVSEHMHPKTASLSPEAPTEKLGTRLQNWGAFPESWGAIPIPQDGKHVLNEGEPCQGSGASDRSFLAQAASLHRPAQGLAGWLFPPSLSQVSPGAASEETWIWSICTTRLPSPNISGLRSPGHSLEIAHCQLRPSFPSSVGALPLLFCPLSSSLSLCCCTSLRGAETSWFSR